MNNQVLKRKNGSRKMSIMKIVVLLVFSLGLCTGVTSANFEDMGVGARQIALGNAFSAIADDVNTIYYNPAGLEKLRWMELSTFTGKIYEGLTDDSSLGNNYLAFGYPLGVNGTVGISWHNFVLYNYYSENTYTLGYARKVRDPLDYGFLSVGLNLKLLTRMFGETAYTEKGVNLDTGYTMSGRDPLFENGYTSSGISMDFGILYTLMHLPEHSFALVVRNLNSPDMGLSSRNNLGISDNVGRELRLGYAYTVSQLNYMVDISLEKNGLFLSAGVEKMLLGGLYAVRGGYSIGSGGLSKISCGGMYRNSEQFQVDYGFSLPTTGVISTLGTHRLSITLRFGPNVPVMVDKTARLRKLERSVESAVDEMERIITSNEVLQKQRMIKKTKSGVSKIKQEIKALEVKERATVDKYYKDGLIEYSKGNIERAIWHWESALRIDPNSEKVRNALSQAKRELKR